MTKAILFLRGNEKTEAVEKTSWLGIQKRKKKQPKSSGKQAVQLAVQLAVKLAVQ